MSGPIVSDEPNNRAAACAALEKARQILEASVERTNPNLIDTISDLAYCLGQDRQNDRARALHLDVLARLPAVPTSQRARAFHAYGRFLGDIGDFKGSVEYQRRAIADREAVFGPIHDSVLRGWYTLAEVLRSSHRFAEALAAMNEVIGRCERAGITPPMLADLLAERGEALRELGRFQEAKRDHLAALALYERLGMPEVDRHMAYYGLGAVHGHLDQPTEAVKYLALARDLYPEGTVRPALRAQATMALAAAYAMRPAGRRDACVLAKESLADMKRDGGALDLQIGEIRQFMAELKCDRYK
jgi:tetratricopeptide (TPR) repeat protein